MGIRARCGGGIVPSEENDEVRRCILSNSRAISCAIDDFPVPACPKRTRPRSEAGLLTQLIMKFRNATRVPIRQPLTGLNRELNPYGISLIFESSSMTTIGSVIQKPSKTTYRRLKLESIFFPIRPEFGTQ